MKYELDYYEDDDELVPARNNPLWTFAPVIAGLGIGVLFLGGLVAYQLSRKK